MYVVCVLLCSYCAPCHGLGIKPALLPAIIYPLVENALMTAERFLKPKPNPFRHHSKS